MHTNRRTPARLRMLVISNSDTKTQPELRTMEDFRKDSLFFISRTIQETKVKTVSTHIHRDTCIDDSVFGEKLAWTAHCAVKNVSTEDVP